MAINIRDFIQVIKYKLATAVSAGIVKGTTSIAEGHEHHFSVLYDDRAKMFWGTTSRDGQGAHNHYIAASVFDVMGPVDRTADKRENTEELVVPITNMPANMQQLLNFWNKKEIVLMSHPSFPNDHTHTLVLRYAGAAGENNPNPTDSKNKNDGGSANGKL
jgi:hypothetical protein